MAAKQYCWATSPHRNLTSIPKSLQGARIIFEAIRDNFAGVDYPAVEPTLAEMVPDL